MAIYMRRRALTEFASFPVNPRAKDARNEGAGLVKTFENLFEDAPMLIDGIPGNERHAIEAACLDLIAHAFVTGVVDIDIDHAGRGVRGKHHQLIVVANDMRLIAGTATVATALRW